jgi:hypothetical protein
MSNNDATIEQLSICLLDFPGTSNQTQCFLHILNITAKAIIKQFDIPNTRNGIVMDQVAQVLASLAEGLDIKEQEAYKTKSAEMMRLTIHHWTVG